MLGYLNKSYLSGGETRVRPKLPMLKKQQSLILARRVTVEYFVGVEDLTFVCARLRNGHLEGRQQKQEELHSSPCGRKTTFT